MQMPAYENKINWNTYISLAGFIFLIGANLIGFGEFRARVGELDRKILTLEENVVTWRVSHMDYHRERATEIATTNNRFDSRISTIESRLQELNTLVFRVQTLEAGAASLTRSIGDLTAAISTLTGDIRVIREGIDKLEQRQVSTVFPQRLVTDPPPAPQQ